MEEIFTVMSSIFGKARTAFLLAVILCRPAIGQEVGQRLLDRVVSVQIENASFEEALKSIEKAAAIKFAYHVALLEGTGQVTLRSESRTLGEVLEELFKSRNIKYIIHEKGGSVTLRKVRTTEEKDNGDGISETNKTTGQRVVQVSGTVKDAANGTPLVGVNILIKGTAAGATTDVSGHYSLAVDADDILVFSFIGYTTSEQPINGRATIDVALQEDIVSLNDLVVNAGYWEVQEKELTGSIGRIAAEQISKQPVTSPLMAMQGRIPGVVITPANGVAGSVQTIQIRGRNSLRADGNYPLYVIDGVPIDSRPIQSANYLLTGGIDPLSAINPENIESIEILKDADATAIYGSRGANGVILITTKRGKQGTTNVNVQAYGGVGHVSRKIDLMNTQQYLAMRNEAFANDGQAALADLNNPDYAIYFPDLKIWSQTANTDWQKELLGSAAHINDVQLSMSGGSGTTSFRVGTGYHRETTVFPGDFGYRKATMNANLTHTSANDKFTASITLNYGVNNNKLLNDNFVYTALTLPPNAPGYDQDGNLIWQGYDFNIPNPFSRLEEQHTTTMKNLITSGRVSYELLPGLKVLSNFGFSNTDTRQLINTPLSAMVPGSSAPNSSTFADSYANSWTAEPQMSYNKSLSKLNMEWLVGTTWQSAVSESQWIRGVGYLSDELLGNINAASQVIKLSADNTMYRYNALFGRMGYNWDKRYYLNLTARRDGSSRFGPDKRFANFGAVGAAWVFTGEEFVKQMIPFLSFGKLRGSYGSTGSDQIGDYGYVSTYNSSTYTYQGGNVLVPTGLANPGYAWEINRKMELALELGFLNDRLSFGANYYRTRSSNQLVGYPLPALTGFTSVQANLGATVQNSGVELMVTSENLTLPNLAWTTSLVLTVPRNKLVSYPNLEGSSYANTLVVGQPLSIVKLYHYEDIDPQTGLYQFTDIDDNGSINTSDRQTIVNVGRRYYGGLNNTFQYRGFECSFFLEVVNQTARGYMSTFSQVPGAAINQPAFIASEARWKEVGSEADIQKFTNYGTEYGRAVNSDLNVENGSFVRMKTASISYQLPSQWMEKIRVKDASIFVQAQNLFMITRYQGLDPEIPANSQLPQLRIVTAGISMKL